MLSPINIVSMNQGKNIPADFYEAWAGKSEDGPSAEAAKSASRGQRIIDFVFNLIRTGHRPAAA